MKEDLGFGCKGNGTVVWDRNRTKSNDYMTVAHISENSQILTIFEPLSTEAIKLLDINIARHIRERNQNVTLANPRSIPVISKYELSENKWVYRIQLWTPVMIQKGQWSENGQTTDYFVDTYFLLEETTPIYRIHSLKDLKGIFTFSELKWVMDLCPHLFQTRNEQNRIEFINDLLEERDTLLEYVRELRRILEQVKKGHIYKMQNDSEVLESVIKKLFYFFAVPYKVDKTFVIVATPNCEEDDIEKILNGDKETYKKLLTEKSIELFTPENFVIAFNDGHIDSIVHYAHLITAEIREKLRLNDD